MESLVIRPGCPADLDALKALADAHKREIGFVRRGELLTAIETGHLLVAEETGRPCGFVQYHHRRDGQTTIYLIIVDSTYRAQGIGRQLVAALQALAAGRGQVGLGLKCPVELEANAFYRRVGFAHIAQEPGRVRALNRWHLPLPESGGDRMRSVGQPGA